MTVGYDVRKALGVQYVLDLLAPCSPYGAELARRPRAYGRQDREALLLEWQNLGILVHALQNQRRSIDKLKRLFMQVRDLRGTFARCEETVLSEVELFEVKRFLLQLSLIVPLVREMQLGLSRITLTEETDVLDLLDPEGRRAAGFSIGDAYSEPLALIREQKRVLEQALRQEANSPKREKLMAERNAVIAREEAETLKIRVRLSECLRPSLGALQANALSIGRLDFLVEKAELAASRDAVCPRITEGEVCFRGMTHPQMEDTLASLGQPFTRVDIQAPVGATVITGANMGGKSVALRTVAMNLLLCQWGFFAFAEEAALPLFDALHWVGEGITQAETGLSSFGAEVVGLQALLAEIDSGSFVFAALDEPARGTNPREGAALAKALVQRLAGVQSVSVVATHFDGVAASAQAHYQAAGFRGEIGDVITGDRLAYIAKHMNYGLRPVAKEAEAPRDALAICRLLGLDPEVVEQMERAIDDRP